MQEPAQPDEPTFTLANGRYGVLEALGEGGTATVHRCVDRDLGVERAIKIRRVREEDIDTSMVKRLADEARVMARLDHPHILPVYDVGMDQGWQYVVMELATGSLSDRTKREGAYSAHQAVEMVLDLLDALAVAHDAGIVHRDIKPHNVLIAKQDGKVLLADWGIALLGDRDQTLTRTGMAMGSVSYMAPEQRLDAHDVGPPADVYATSAMLYNLITCASPVDLFTAQEASPRWDGVPEELVPVLRKACAYEVSDRYPTAAIFAQALRDVHAHMPDLPLVTTPNLDRETHGTLAVPPTLEASRNTVERLVGTRWVTPVGLVLLTVSIATLVIALGWSGVSDPAPSSTPVVSTVPPAGAPMPEPETPEPQPALPTPDPVPTAPVERVTVRTPSRPDAPAGTEEPVAPEPASTDPGIPSVAVLPIHGPWVGSVEGTVTRLSLDGPTGALTGTVTISAAAAPASGRFDADSKTLTLQVGGEGPGAGTWTCAVEGSRLRGTIARAAGADVVPVSLRRVASR